MACGGPRRQPVHHFARPAARPAPGPGGGPASTSPRAADRARPAGSPPAGPGYYACRKARASAAKSGVPRPVAGFHTRPGEPV